MKHSLLPCFHFHSSIVLVENLQNVNLFHQIVSAWNTKKYTIYEIQHWVKMKIYVDSSLMYLEGDQTKYLEMYIRSHIKKTTKWCILWTSPSHLQILDAVKNNPYCQILIWYPDSHSYKSQISEWTKYTKNETFVYYSYMMEHTSEWDQEEDHQDIYKIFEKDQGFVKTFHVETLKNEHFIQQPLFLPHSPIEQVKNDYFQRVDSQLNLQSLTLDHTT